MFSHLPYYILSLPPSSLIQRSSLWGVLQSFHTELSWYVYGAEGVCFTFFNHLDVRLLLQVGAGGLLDVRNAVSIGNTTPNNVIVRLAPCSSICIYILQLSSQDIYFRADIRLSILGATVTITMILRPI